MSQKLTYDHIFEIALSSNLDTLENLCKTDKTIAKICKSPFFWKKKLEKDYKLDHKILECFSFKKNYNIAFQSTKPGSIYALFGVFDNNLADILYQLHILDYNTVETIATVINSHIIEVEIINKDDKYYFLYGDDYNNLKGVFSQKLDVLENRLELIISDYNIVTDIMSLCDTPILEINTKPEFKYDKLLDMDKEERYSYILNYLNNNF